MKSLGMYSLRAFNWVVTPLGFVWQVWIESFLHLLIFVFGSDRLILLCHTVYFFKLNSLTAIWNFGCPFGIGPQSEPIMWQIQISSNKQGGAYFKLKGQ